MALKEDELKNLQDNLHQIGSHPTWTVAQKNKAWFDMLSLILETGTAEEKLRFTTLFSRLAFVGVKYQLPKNILHYCHIFRKGHEKNLINSDNKQYYEEVGQYVCHQLSFLLWRIPIQKESISEVSEAFFMADKKAITGFKSIVEAVLFEINDTQKTLHFYDEEAPTEEKVALYDIHDRNELFTSNIESLIKHFPLPIHINFIDTEIREDGVYLPMGWVVHPDHLIDVTSISECFKDFGVEPILFLLSRFKPQEFSISLMVGNLVNFMLDEIIHRPEIQFADLLKKMFPVDPLGFALLDDNTMKDTLQQLKEHYKNLCQVIYTDFKKYDIQSPNTYLEPSFYSRDYGIQGRLDLLHQKSDKMTYDIIELKSGKTFKPNVYGINASHYIQTLLYDLMVQSAFQSRAKSYKYILYSKEAVNSLRFAPPVRQQQYEAMKLRNDILAIIQSLKTPQSTRNLLSYIKPSNFPKLKGFNAKDIDNFYNMYQYLDETEKSYFDSYTTFITREYALARTGEHGIDKSYGHSALWLETDDEKIERFALLRQLEIKDNQSTHEDSLIVFKRAENDISLVNFRVGDIAVIYPVAQEVDRPVLKNQIFKGSITDIKPREITVKLRSQQYNQNIFNDNKHWNIELDSLDSSFTMMYKNLYSWGKSEKAYKNLILGRQMPQSTKIKALSENKTGMTAVQSQLMDKVLAAQDYFLLWGPPGTGKTSVMLKNIVAYLYQNTQENILLLAYTNRAVDEICEAICQIGEGMQNEFIRIGSRLSTSEKYQANLLDVTMKKMSTRKDIVSWLQEKRIYISTLSSFHSKQEISLFKHFDTVIVDEASQILEPMIIGLLEPFKRRLLIGDHKQLPAVVVQDGLSSQILDENLNLLGIEDTRTSLFERLYIYLVKNKWDHAYGILYEQGRMHQELMKFPNQYFYAHQLKTLPDNQRQIKPQLYEKYNEALSWLSNRLLYIPTKEDHDLNWKTNVFEAETCCLIIKNIIEVYEMNNKKLQATSIGIITPYRAQIALINQKINDLPEKYRSIITIDTVERYQGSARDIIIYSFCVNKKSQLEALVSPSKEGIDRKLNVALTRAKEQIILVGNESILSQNDTFKLLLKAAFKHPMNP